MTIATPGIDTEAAAVEAAAGLMKAGVPELAAQGLELLVAHQRDAFIAWLALGDARELAGDALGALEAYFQAVTRAQQPGQWLNHGQHAAGAAGQRRARDRARARRPA